jgi:hypothetical protein
MVGRRRKNEDEEESSENRIGFRRKQEDGLISKREEGR